MNCQKCGAEGVVHHYDCTPAPASPCHPYDEECGPWGLCRNHGGVVAPDRPLTRLEPPDDK